MDMLTHTLFHCWLLNVLKHTKIKNSIVLLCFVLFFGGTVG
jgi:hypothetical protein